MSEELNQRKLTKQGLPFGPYEFYNIGATTLRTLRQFRIVPDRPYEGKLSNKPDALLVDRRDLKKVVVIAVVEHKAINEFDTPEKKQKAIAQCVDDYCRPLGAKVGVVTDGIEYVWVNPQSGNGYETIMREDGYALHLPFAWTSPGEIAQTLEILDRVLADISPANSQLQQAQLQNPSNLAERVWQTIWLASGENPDACLATFVEVFLFKYLSDLGVLVKNHAGVGISFSDTLAIDRDRCLVFYFDQVRPYIKQIFPPGPDGSSIINGIVLDPEVSEHNYLLYQILREFEGFGPLTNIDPEFKSRLYENFLKKSISQKNWGQFFTPRNIVKAMIEMSDIEQLGDGAKVHDPACGVGGFILEPILTKRPRDYEFETGRLTSKLDYSGHDRDLKTIILAKANMLIHLNELMRANAGSPREFANIFNGTFTSLHTSILGSLGVTTKDEYDLILTNPPFVVAGTSKFKDFIRDNGDLRQYYAVNASGVEGLFLEKIIRSIKPGGKAFVIVPDGIMNRLSDSKLRQFIRDECIVEAIVSLPENTFYTTPKKTYILALTKKPVRGTVQLEPVFTYLVINTGETLDANRFETDNDLPEMVRLFKYFKADKENFASPTLQCKAWPIDRFSPDTHWSVDRWWSEQEKIALGVAHARNLTTLSDFTSRLEDEKRRLDEAILKLKALDEELLQPEFPVEISLGDEEYFELFIGKRVVMKEVHGKPEGEVPIYSANVKQPMAMMDTSNISDFSNDFVLWAIDGDLEFNVIRRGDQFGTTDHCGCIRIIDSEVDPDYLYYYLSWIRSTETLDRQLRANIRNMKKLAVRFPVLVEPNGDPRMKPSNRGATTPIYVLDIETQKQIAAVYKTFEQVKAEIADRMQQLATLEIPPLT